MSTTERDALVLALDRALQAGLIGHDAENFLLTEIDAALAAPSGGMPTPPPVAQEAVDEAIALLVEQMDMLRADAQKWHDGDPKVPFAVIRDALIAALNAYDDAVPALRALLKERDRADESERKLNIANGTIANLMDNSCAYCLTSAEGTSYCTLAERTVEAETRKREQAERERDALRARIEGADRKESDWSIEYGWSFAANVDGPGLFAIVPLQDGEG